MIMQDSGMIEHKTINGIKLPMVGIGTYQMGDMCERSLLTAIQEGGYRLIDTASYYKTEEAVGNAIKNSGVARNEIIITTKIWCDDIKNGTTEKSIEASLRKLDTDYIDVVLLHWPFFNIRESWRVLEKKYDERIARIIGVCNFQIDHLEELSTYANVKPMINQFERNPHFQQTELYNYCITKDILIEAWGPLEKGLYEDSAIRKVALKYGKNEAQIILRWLTMSGCLVIPKSITVDHILNNIDIFDFFLDKDDINLINSLDTGISKRFYPPEYKYVKTQKTNDERA